MRGIDLVIEREFSLFKGLSAVVRSFGVLDYAALHPGELSAGLAISSAKRRRDFLCGRAVARLALVEVGCFYNSPILRAEMGEPVWPGGLVGSISHSGDLVGCVISSSSVYSSVGMDIQRFGGAATRYKMGILRRICSPGEIRWVCPSDVLDCSRFFAIFSAKEAFYKAFFPLCRGPLSLGDVEFRLDCGASGLPASGEGIATLVRDLDFRYRRGFTFPFRMACGGGYAFSCLVLETW